MKKRILWGAGLLAALLLTGFVTFAADCGEIRDSVLRLHILAESDDPEDQRLKLLVRDAVTGQCAGLFDGAATREQARELAGQALPEIERIAEQTLRDNGCELPVRAELTHMYFTTRTYDTATLPAGQYDALRLTIGSGQGHNWWCMIFPPLCVSAASDHTTLSDVLDERQLDVVEHAERYTVRLKVVEWWEALAEKCRSWFS